VAGGSRAGCLEEEDVLVMGGCAVQLLELVIVVRIEGTDRQYVPTRETTWEGKRCVRLGFAVREKRKYLQGSLYSLLFLLQF
jgi:hypothetical protein